MDKHETIEITHSEQLKDLGRLSDLKSVRIIGDRLDLSLFPWGEMKDVTILFEMNYCSHASLFQFIRHYSKNMDIICYQIDDEGQQYWNNNIAELIKNKQWNPLKKYLEYFKYFTLKPEISESNCNALKLCGIYRFKLPLNIHSYLFYNYPGYRKIYSMKDSISYKQVLTKAGQVQIKIKKPILVRILCPYINPTSMNFHIHNVIRKYNKNIRIEYIQYETELSPEEILQCDYLVTDSNEYNNNKVETIQNLIQHELKATVLYPAEFFILLTAMERDEREYLKRNHPIHEKEVDLYNKALSNNLSGIKRMLLKKLYTIKNSNKQLEYVLIHNLDKLEEWEKKYVFDWIRSHGSFMGRLFVDTYFDYPNINRREYRMLISNWKTNIDKHFSKIYIEDEVKN